MVWERTTENRRASGRASCRFVYLEAAKELIRRNRNGRGCGAMTTFGIDGSSELRIRDTFAVPNLEFIYSLSSKESREIENIYFNPRIEWTFTRFDERALATVKGNAELIESRQSRNWVLGKLGLKESESKMGASPDSADLVVIKTHVAEVAYMIPEDRLFESFNLELVTSHVKQLMKCKTSLREQVAS